MSRDYFKLCPNKITLRTNTLWSAYASIVSAGHAGVNQQRNPNLYHHAVPDFGTGKCESMNPQYNHYLFESLSALVKFVGGRTNSSANIEHIWIIVIPALYGYLEEKIESFHAVRFQIFAQLLELRQNGMGLSNGYKELFQPLLDPHCGCQEVTFQPSPHSCCIPQSCARSVYGEVTAIVRLLAKCVLNAFNFNQTHLTCSVIVTCLPLQNIQQFLPQIFNLLLTLQDPKRNTINDFWHFCLIWLQSMDTSRLL